MALPALIGLSALGAMIGRFFAVAFDLLFSKLVKRIAVLTLIVKAMQAAIYTLLESLVTLISPLLDNLPEQVKYISYALPDNTLACLSVVIAVEIVCLTYVLTMKALNMKSQVID